LAEWAYERGQDAQGESLRLSGRLLRSEGRALFGLLERTLPRRGATLTLDLSGVAEMDGAAVAALAQAWRQARAAGGTVRLGPVSEPARRSLSMFRLRAEGVTEPAPPPPFFEGLGGGVFSGAAQLRDLLQVAADTTFAIAGLALHPRRIRWGALAEQAVYIGSQALFIVGLIAFLVGLTLAFQSAYQLRQFGADIFVANLAGVAMVREMGPLMTAILVAGRSGSSIAAEIATMKVSEEVDALQTMGIDPLVYLALPRLLAIVATVPLLTVLADLLGILGGFLVGVVYLDISPVAFLSQTLEALVPKDLLTGVAKSVAFAWGIGIIGLYHGFAVRGGAAEVGRTTTSSVVAAIFYIIVADCFFSVLFYIVL